MTPVFLRATADIEVAFHECDPMGVVWHGNYLRYFEAARNVLFRGVNYDFQDMKDCGHIWPVVDCQLRFSYPARYGMKLVCSAELIEWENRVKVRYELRDPKGLRLCKGTTVQVAVDAASGEMLFVSPQSFRDRLLPHIKQGL